MYIFVACVQCIFDAILVLFDGDLRENSCSNGYVIIRCLYVCLNQVSKFIMLFFLKTVRRKSISYRGKSISTLFFAPDLNSAGRKSISYRGKSISSEAECVFCLFYACFGFLLPPLH